MLRNLIFLESNFLLGFILGQSKSFVLGLLKNKFFAINICILNIDAVKDHDLIITLHIILREVL